METQEQAIHRLGTLAADCGIPVHMRDGVVSYIVQGQRAGGFLTAVIVNDLRKAVRAADGTNVNKLKNYVVFFDNHAPMGCWGSVEAYSKWRGLNLPVSV
jgi:hypothetical protein